MKPFRILWLVPFLLSFASCGRVLTVVPVATETEAYLQEELEGTWRLGDGVFHLAFDELGEGHFAWLEWKEGTFAKTAGVFQAALASDKIEQGFLSLRVAEGEEVEAEAMYVFCSFKLVDSDSILLWQAEPFEDYVSFVENGELEGEIEGSGGSKRVIISDGPALAARVEEFPDYFNLENPVIMTRVIPKEAND